MQARATKGRKFRIVEFTNPSGNTVYRVTGWRGAARIRQNFKTHGEAVARLSQLEIEAHNLSDAARPVVTRMSPPQVAQAERAFDALGTVDLMTAVNYYLKNYREPVQHIQLEDAIAGFEKYMLARNLRGASLAGARSCLTRFQKDIAGNKRVAEITPDDLRLFIHSSGLSPVSSLTRRKRMQTFLNWCVTNGYLVSNPLAGTKAPEVEQGEPETLTVEQVRHLMRAAAEHEEGILVPYLVLTLFAGIRPHEVRRLSWNDIQLGEHPAVVIRASASKVRQRRVVELSHNAVAWLKPFAMAKPALVPVNFQRHLVAVRKASGIKAWPQDVLRHTALSNHYALHEHEGKTAAWAGNSPDILMRHYRRLTTKQDAQSFWAIGPDAAAPAKARRVA